MTVEQLTKKFAGSPKHILIAESKEKLKEMLDFINTLSSTQSISESDINSLNKEPLNQKNYVVKLQRIKASVRRAEVLEGNRVCSKVHKLQYQANLLATQSALDEAKKELSDLKCAYPFDFEEVINTTDEVESLKKGLDTLKLLGKELGFE